MMRNSNGTSGQKPDLFLKDIRIQRYFRNVTNVRHRKKIIHSLEEDEGMIEGHEQLKSYITKYYKCLFGSPEEGNFSLSESQTNDIPKVFNEENNFLAASFYEEEVKKTVFQVRHNKAPDPYGVQ